jgi:NitT/TauT family transport system substrate-binding protein
MPEHSFRVNKKFLNTLSQTSRQWLVTSMKTAWVFHFFLLIVFAVAVTACMSQVKVAYLPLISNGPLFIAYEEGYFSRQGMQVEFEKFQSAPSALPALINGDIAVSGGQLSPGFVNAVTKGSRVRIVADKGRASLGSCNATALVVRKDLFDQGTVTRASDLKGRKIMASSDQSYGIFRVLAMGNLTADDVEIVDMDFASGVAALRNDAVDAGVLTEPYLTQALISRSAVVLIPAQEYSPDWPTLLYYGPVFLDKDPDLGRRFMVAYLQGVRQYNLGKTERNLAILGNYTHIDQDLLQQSCWVPISPDGDLPRKPVRDYLDWMYANKKITQNVDDDQLYDMSFVTYANGILSNTGSSR